MNTSSVMLLVEDNPDEADLAILAFKESEFVNEIVLAEDGVEAVDYLFGTGSYSGRNTSLMPQIVVLDLKLPRMDGLEVLRRIRADERTKLIPVVVLTSSDEEIDIVQSYSAGANSYLRKPVGFHEFIAAARTVGLYWLVMNQPPPSARV